MAVLLTLSLFVVLLLSIVSLFLYLDARGQRHALRAATETLAAVQRQTAEHDRQLATVARAMAVVVAGPPHVEERIEPPLAVRIGGEVLELDAETIARIDALAEDLNGGRFDGALLQRVIEAGFDEVSEEAPASGEVTVELGDRESEGSEQEESGVESGLAFPELTGSRDTTPSPVTPTKPSCR